MQVGITDVMGRICTPSSKGQKAYEILDGNNDWNEPLQERESKLENIRRQQIKQSVHNSLLQ